MQNLLDFIKNFKLSDYGIGLREILIGVGLYVALHFILIILSEVFLSLKKTKQIIKKTIDYTSLFVLIFFELQLLLNHNYSQIYQSIIFFIIAFLGTHYDNWVDLLAEKIAGTRQDLK